MLSDFKARHYFCFFFVLQVFPFIKLLYNCQTYVILLLQQVNIEPKEAEDEVHNSTGSGREK